MLQVDFLLVSVKFNVIEAVQMLFGDALNTLLQMQTDSLLIFF